MEKETGQLIVNGQPFLILGGELGNSSAGTSEEADLIVPRLARMHVNTVLMPVAWEQLMSLKGGAQWTITTAREYLSFEQKDPWTDYWTTAQSIVEGMKVLGYKPSGRRNATGDKV